MMLLIDHTSSIYPKALHLTTSEEISEIRFEIILNMQVPDMDIFPLNKYHEWENRVAVNSFAVKILIYYYIVGFILLSTIGLFLIKKNKKLAQ